MKINRFYMLFIALFVISGCQKGEVVKQNLKPVFSQITTYPEIVVKNRETKYSCNITNYDNTCELTRTYVKIGDGYSLENFVVDGVLSTTKDFENNTTVAFLASYWDYDLQEYRYVEQVYDVKLKEPYFHSYIFGDELDYIYSDNVNFDINNPEQRGDGLYYLCYIEEGEDNKTEDFDYYYFNDRKLSGAGRSTHLEVMDVFDASGLNGIGNFMVYLDSGFNYTLFGNITVQTLEVVYAEGFTPSESELSVIEQIVNNYTVSDERGLQIISDLVLDGKVQFSLEIALNDYPELIFTAFYTVYDYTPDGKLTRELTLSKK